MNTHAHVTYAHGFMQTRVRTPPTHRYAEALADAVLLTERWPLWPKSWLRAARAQEGQGNNARAAHLYARAWQLQSGELDGTAFFAAHSLPPESPVI